MKVGAVWLLLAWLAKQIPSIPEFLFSFLRLENEKENEIPKRYTLQIITYEGKAM